MAKLSKQQYHDLFSALLDAFPSIGPLKMMVHSELSMNLEEIIIPKNLQEAADELIKWCQEKDRIKDLVDGARAANPSNGMLLAFAMNNPFNKIERYRRNTDAPHWEHESSERDNGISDPTESFFGDSLDSDEKSFLLTVALFQGMSRHKIVTVYGEVKDIMAKYL